jgi:hypothetical protein
LYALAEIGDLGLDVAGEHGGLCFSYTVTEQKSQICIKMDVQQQQDSKAFDKGATVSKSIIKTDCWS